MDEMFCRMPLIGEKAPYVECETTQGHLAFPEHYKGRWVVLFSHPADFTPVCTTEFMTFAAREKEFQDLYCDLVGLSIDSTFSHIAWVRRIKEAISYRGMRDIEIRFPIIADLSMEVARLYGMLQPCASTTQAVRAVFIIDPESIIRAILFYPMSNGRNIDEILRLLKALQFTDEHKVATPEGWQPGDDVIIPPPTSCEIADERVAGAGKDYECLDWFMCLRKNPAEK